MKFYVGQMVECTNAPHVGLRGIIQVPNAGMAGHPSRPYATFRVLPGQLYANYQMHWYLHDLKPVEELPADKAALEYINRELHR